MAAVRRSGSPCRLPPRPERRRNFEEPRSMLDLIAIVVTFLFFALAIWYVRFCERI